MTLIAASLNFILAAQFAAGDVSDWATVGGALTALGFVGTKLLIRLQRR